MTALAEPILRLMQKAAAEGQVAGLHVGPDLYLKVFPNDVINIDTQVRKLRREDVEAVRAALEEIGYTEVYSWIPMQGVSWLSEGLPCGVSFRIEKKQEGPK